MPILGQAPREIGASHQCAQGVVVVDVLVNITITGGYIDYGMYIN
jgi:hypothetical protein